MLSADELLEPAKALNKGLAFVQAYNTVDALIAYIGAVRQGFAVHLLDPSKAQANARLMDLYAPDVVVDVMADNPVDVRGDGRDIHPDISILLSTSGSTGTAKLVKLTNKNITSNTQAIVEYLQLTAQDVGVTNLKLFYSYGMSVVNTHLTAGGSLVVTDRGPDDPVFWELAAQHGVTNIAGVPYNYEVIRQEKSDLASLPSLRMLTQAGGKLAPATVKYFADTGEECGFDFCVMYGQTEASPRMSYLPPELASKSPTSIGKAIPGGRLYLVDDKGNTISEPGVSGELVYEGPNVMAGYAETRIDLTTIETIPRLLTGDLAHFDDHGLFYIDGRSARFVKPFGLRISLDEIEIVLQEDQPFVAATGTDDRIVIALSDTVADTAEIATRLGARFGLPPALFEVNSGDPIPRLHNGKTDYKSLLSGPEHTASQPSLMHFFLRDLCDVLIGRTQAPASVYEAFQIVLGNRVTDRSTTFRIAGGDSLTYMQLYLLLEEHMGSVPENWADIPITELDAMTGKHLV